MLQEGLQDRVEWTRKCWLLLSELVSLTGYSIGIVMASISMTAFLALIIYGYGYFTSLLDTEGHPEWWMGFMVLLHSLIFFFHLDSADKTLNEVLKVLLIWSITQLLILVFILNAIIIILLLSPTYM